MDSWKSLLGGNQSGSATRQSNSSSRMDRLSKKNFFETAVVVEFVANPEEFLSILVDVDEENQKSPLRAKVTGSGNKAKRSMRGELLAGSKKVTNEYLVGLMPRNSIVGHTITGGKSKYNKDPEIFFPFFSQHICMPVKPGEHVWVFYENIDGKQTGYWISRKTGSIFTDDANFTSAERQLSIADLIDASSSASLSKSKLKTLTENLGYRFTAPSEGGDGSADLPVTPDHIVVDSISYSNEFIGEPVPRYKKKCGDLVLQGSNNTLISLTNEGDLTTGKICIVAGRGKTETTAPAVIGNKRSKIAKNLEYEEVNKTLLISGDEPNLQEGDVDIENDAASIIISETDGGSVRIGNAAGAYIELKTNGDICIVPAEDGVIRMGGEDANVALLGQTGNDTAGLVTSNGYILSTAGGTIGEGDPETAPAPAPMPGRFASKILVK